MTNEGMVGLTDASVEIEERKDFSQKTTRVLRFKAGQTYRVKFCSEQVLLRRRHYNSMKKKYYRCLDYLGYCPVCVAASDKINGAKRASDTFGANMLVYDMNADGTVKQPLNAEVHFWAFGSEKFSSVRAISQEWGNPMELDLLITCTDENFQKVQISPCRNCLYLENEEFRAACDAKIKEDSYPLDKFLCKEIPIVEMCKEWNLPVDRYIPEEIMRQITGGGNAAQDAAARVSQSGIPQGQPAQQTPTQSYPQNTQPAQSVNQAPPQQAPQQPVYQPTPEAQQQMASNFADLENLTSIL